MGRRGWILACVAAEAIGMTAAAAAARAADAVDPVAVALGLVVVGGLVEGVALGVLQGRWLRANWPSLRLRLFVATTIVFAGLGWAAGAAPSVLSDDAGGGAPPVWMMLAGAAGIGMVMGSALGAAQAAALRGAVTHPWRWVAANATAWPVAMVVLFAGASTPTASWPVALVVPWGTAVGALAGLALGLITAVWLPTLDGQPVRNRLALWMLAKGQLGGAGSGGLVGLAVHGRHTGRIYRFPVQAARDTSGLVVVVGNAKRKTWWLNLTEPATVEVLLDGRWQPAEATALPHGDAWEQAVQRYQARWRRARVAADAAVVLVELSPSAHLAASRSRSRSGA